MSRALLACARLLLGGSLMGSCGWHAGLLAPPTGAKTVGVEYFELHDDVLERDLEPLLHDQLTRAVTDLVDAQLVSPNRADLVVRGRILDYRRRGGIRSTDNVLLETAVRIAVEASLVDRSTGEVLARTRSSLPSGYVTAERIPGGGPTGEDVFLMGGRENELDARERAIRYLADQLVLDLFGRKGLEVP